MASAAFGCTAEDRASAAESLFIKAVNLKCKVTKSEARLAWNLGDELGAGRQARKIQAKSEEQTSLFVAELDRLNGPADLRQQVSELLSKSSAVVNDVSNGDLSVEKGRAQLDDLRQQARDKGLGECLSL